MEKKEQKKELWLVGRSGTTTDGVFFDKVYGTKKQVKKYLFDQVMEERESDPFNHWDFGTESVDEVEERPDGTLYAFGCYSDTHTDYSAIRMDEIGETVILQENTTTQNSETNKGKKEEVA